MGLDVYRRSLYTHWRPHLAHHPTIVALTFDAPRRAVVFTGKTRYGPSTPLQALILLNGAQYVEAARAWGAFAREPTAMRGG